MNGFAFGYPCGEHAFAAVFLFEVNPFAFETRRLISGKRGFGVCAYAAEAWKQPIFNQDLEAVAYAQNRSALVYELVHFLAQV